MGINLAEAEIRLLDLNEIIERIYDFKLLLQDAVERGASVGFLPPVTESQAEAYWGHVVYDLLETTRVVLGAIVNDRVVGTVQLVPEMRPSGRHRADVQKLMVLNDYRRKGLGAALMQGVEEAARARNLTLLLLDVRAGDPAERVFARQGYTRAGIIPGFARSGDGSLEAAGIYYKGLDSVDSSGAG
jgi:ribosomal protein S18 acetylase RimI-like enzyme